jgi:hypothetical protein
MRDHEQSNGTGLTRAPRGAIVIVATCALVASAATTADAQTPPPPGYQPAPAAVAPPPAATPQPYSPGAYGQPAPGYGQPATVYYTTAPPGYGPPAPGPRVLDWEEGQPLQPGYHAETRIRKGLVAGGAATFGTTYLFTALAGAIIADAKQSGFEPLFVPVVGPFITIGTGHVTSSGAFFLILDGLAQSAGVAMFVAGLALPKTVQVRNDAVSVRAMPMTFGQSSAGAGLIGRF